MFLCFAVADDTRACQAATSPPQSTSRIALTSHLRSKQVQSKEWHTADSILLFCISRSILFCVVLLERLKSLRKQAAKAPSRNSRNVPHSCRSPNTKAQLVLQLFDLHWLATFALASIKSHRSHGIPIHAWPRPVARQSHGGSCRGVYFCRLEFVAVDQ